LIRSGTIHQRADLCQTPNNSILDSVLENPEGFKARYGFNRIPFGLIEIAKSKHAAFLSWHASGFKEHTNADGASEVPGTTQQVEKIMTRNREKIERKLEGYAKRGFNWYYNNALERQAHPGGVLAYLLGESQGL